MKTSVALLGVKGGPAIRPGSNMPTSHLLNIAGRTILVDAGLGATRGVTSQGVALPSVDMIFITHLHSDHYLELGPFFHTAWVAGLTRPIRVFGPTGLSRYWEAFLASMEFDIRLRIADEGRCELRDLAQFAPLADGVVFEEDGLRVTAMTNLHPPIRESFALRFDHEGTGVVLSGDTAFMPEMIDFARDANLLVHEAMLVAGVDALCARTPNGDERLRSHLMRSHTAAGDVGRIAAAAGVGKLILNHFVPDGDPNFGDEDWVNAVRCEWMGPLVLAKDGMKIEV